MPEYAVKIGEIFVVSDKPITEKQRKQAIRKLKRLALVRSSLVDVDGGARLEDRAVEK